MQSRAAIRLARLEDPMSIAGLQQGAITLDRSNLVCGGAVPWKQFTRCMGNHGSPDIREAIEDPATAIITGSG